MKLTISTPSRLHFGLLSVGSEVERAFGGVGLMVSSPRTIIEAIAAEEFSVQRCHVPYPEGRSLESIVGSAGEAKSEMSGDNGSSVENSDRRVTAATAAAQRWFRHFAGDALQGHDSLDTLPVKIIIGQACTPHIGLGSGTQLAMAVGLLLQRFFDLPDPKPNEMAQALGRADRSAIGTFGFFEGGLLVDGGRAAWEPVSAIDLRLDFPEHWPIAIVNVGQGSLADSSSVGLHGGAEQAAFDTVSPTTPEQLEHMRSLVNEKMVPSVLSEKYDPFAESVYEFGCRSGQYFASVQGGPYASEPIAQVVETIYNAGVKAVGQTSWGPSVFAIGKSWEHLQSAVMPIKKRFGDHCHIEITRADNQGVMVAQQLVRSSTEI